MKKIIKEELNSNKHKHTAATLNSRKRKQIICTASSDKMDIHAASKQKVPDHSAYYHTTNKGGKKDNSQRPFRTTNYNPMESAYKPAKVLQSAPRKPKDAAAPKEKETKRQT
uniref:Uncharacterized protein n=1 Tax=Micrurus paraensis TaxID=1970185 RepID=A0A2D4JV76_9SAUR